MKRGQLFLTRLLKWVKICLVTTIQTTINGSKDENGIEGINVQDAFDAVTINAAKVLGVDQEMGSITPGTVYRLDRAGFVCADL